MFKQITEAAKNSFTSWEEMIKGEAFKKGVNDFKNGVKQKGEPIIWVKKLVSASQWNNHYSQIPSYTLLEKRNDGFMVGFIVVGGIPRDCQSCSDDDFWKIGNQRRSQNIYPNPLEEKEKSTQISLDEIDVSKIPL